MPTRKRKLPQQHTGEHKKSNPNPDRWTRARTYLNPTSPWPMATPSTPPEKRRGQKTSARRRAKAPAPEMQEPPTPPAEKLICRRRGPQQAPLPAEEARPTHAGKLDLAPPPKQRRRAKPRKPTSYSIYIRTAIPQPTHLSDAGPAAGEEGGRWNRRRKPSPPRCRPFLPSLL